MDSQQLTQAKILLGGAIQPGREGLSEVDEMSDVIYFERLTADNTNQEGGSND